MSLRVKLQDVARACGVSNATVSLALNDSPLVKADTKKLVRDTADRMGYLPNEAARSLVKRSSGQLGVIVPDLCNPFYAGFISRLNREVQGKGYTLTISISDNDPCREDHLVTQMLRNQAEGILIVPINRGNPSPEYVERLRGLKLPFLFAVDRYEGTDAPCVMSDCQRGMYEMIRDLTDGGYRNLVYLNGDLSVASLRARLEGFRRAMAEKGLAGKVREVRSIDYEGAGEAVRRCLEEGFVPEGFVCPNDMMALGAINTLKNAGISVPEQCAVTGFDNVIFSEISSVPITTVHQDLGQIAQKSLEVLLRLVQGEKEPLGELLIPTRGIVRDSTQAKGASTASPWK